MKPSTFLRDALVAAPLLVAPLGAQSWRASAEGIGTTARVLLVGTRPEDEDNPLIAWLSLGRHVETAYLSLTRGEAGVNVIGSERQSALAVVRTAELLAERERDGAHQYFARAYDFGSPRADSVVDAAWPHDSLLKDVVSIIRAFRPHVVVLVHADSADRDATRRLTVRLVREAFAAASDTVRFPAAQTSRLSAWAASRLYTLVDSVRLGTAVAIDVGEFDRDAGRSYAELGADIRRLQRTQPPLAAPPVGHVLRRLRLDSARTGGDASDLFENVDTTWTRFRAVVSDSVARQLDSLRSELRDVRALADRGAPDSLAVALAHVVKRARDLRAGLPCADVEGVPACSGILGDLAVSLTGLRERATHAVPGAAGLVVEGAVARELVAVGDSVPVTVTMFNGGKLPVVVRRLAANSRSAWTSLIGDSAIVRPDSVGRWTSNVRVNLLSLHWWQVNGLIEGTFIHDVFTTRRNPVYAQLIRGEDRIPTSGVEATVSIAGIDVPFVEGPLVYRTESTLRGDARRPIAGVTPISLLFERAAEYERAALPIDRLFRVYVSSARTRPESVLVTVQLPPGLKADSASRVVALPPLGARNVFFRLRGSLKPATDTISAVASTVAAPLSTKAPVDMRAMDERSYRFGIITHEYPHIPSQQFVRSANDRVEAVDLHLPPRLRVAYVKGNDDVQTPLGQLQVNVQALEPSLLSVVDLSVFSTVLIGSGALANDALAGAAESLRGYMRQGGTLIILPNGDDVARSGLLPYPLSFDSTPGRVSDPAAPVRFIDRTSPLLNWPNVITAGDFENWSDERARGVPTAFDSRYRTLLSVGEPGQSPTAATILVATVGKGRFIYTSLSLDRQLTAVHPGAARLFVNLLAGKR